MEKLKSKLIELNNSRHLQDWKIVLIWILFFEFMAVFFEYFFIDNPQKYIETLPEGFMREFFIALLVVVFIWSCVYNIINIKRDTMIFLILYTLLGIYLIVTNDYTFSLLLHNINFFEVAADSPFYIITIEFLLKVILTFLVYRLVDELIIKC